MRSVAALEHTLHYAHPFCLSSADQFTQNWKEGKDTRSLPPSLSSDAEAQPCVSRTARITEAPRFKSPSHSQTLRAVGVAPPACVILSLRAARRSADPGAEDFSRKKKNLSATTDCVTSPSHPVTPPTRTPLPPQSGQRRLLTLRWSHQSAEWGREGGVNAPIRVHCCCPRC